MTQPAEIDAPWHEGGDGHGYGYQYIGPIHYLCECGRHFLNREGWRAHRSDLGLTSTVLPAGCYITPPGSPVRP